MKWLALLGNIGLWREDQPTGVIAISLAHEPDFISLFPSSPAKVPNQKSTGLLCFLSAWWWGIWASASHQENARSMVWNQRAHAFSVFTFLLEYLYLFSHCPSPALGSSSSFSAWPCNPTGTPYEKAHRKHLTPEETKSLRGWRVHELPNRSSQGCQSS